ncbi:MAG TPA: porin [Solimonas sp.]
MKKGIKQAGAATLAIIASVGVAQAAENATNEELDQRIRILERKIEIDKEAAEAKAKDSATVNVSDKGVSIKKGDNEFKFNALVQLDARTYLDDSRAQNDTFTFRRIRPTFQGSVGKLIGYRLTPEFATNNATIVDAYIDLKFDPAYTLRAGKVKGPTGLERLQGGSAITFIERGLPTELVPNRDLGIQLQGDVLSNTLNYTLGYYNGTADGRDGGLVDTDNRKEVAGRLFAEPFKNDGGVLEKLGVGIAASTGTQLGNSTANSAASAVPTGYRSPSQRSFFAYETNVTANGDHTRISPQAYFYNGPFGLLTEYVQSKQEFTRGTGNPTVDVKSTAWQVATSYVITGEDIGYKGLSKVAQPFTVGGEGWGAFEVAARYGELEVDDAAFAGIAAVRLADPDAQSKKASSWTVGVNWYLNNNVKLALNYTNTSFDGGKAGGADRDDDKTVFSRLQLNF